MATRFTGTSSTTTATTHRRRAERGGSYRPDPGGRRCRRTHWTTFQWPRLGLPRLVFARSLGDYLLVAVNSFASASYSAFSATFDASR